MDGRCRGGFIINLTIDQILERSKFCGCTFFIPIFAGCRPDMVIKMKTIYSDLPFLACWKVNLLEFGVTTNVDFEHIVDITQYKFKTRRTRPCVRKYKV